MKLGIIVPNHVSGDAIQYACLPENYFLTVGQKLIDVSSSFVFDYNPYVIRNEEPEQVINLWRHPFKPSYEFLSKSERWCEGLNCAGTLPTHKKRSLQVLFSRKIVFFESVPFFETSWYKPQL